MIVKTSASSENPNEADRKGNVEDGYRTGTAINAADVGSRIETSVVGIFRCGGGGLGTI